jgi:hypothetical protein
MNALRIFAHVPRRRSLARPGKPPSPPLAVVVATEDEEMIAPAITEPEPVPVIEVSEPIEMIAAAIEQTICDVLASGPAVGETIDAAYRRKERELSDVFGSLTRSEAAILLRRFSDPRADDVLAQRFTRLVVDRRTRLLGVLADIPRRAARRR